MANPTEAFAAVTDLAELWHAYVQWRKPEIRDRLISHYLPLAKKHAARQYRNRVVSSVGFDDYLQYARLGLIESIDRFDIQRGVVFEAYAAHRIRGAILNGLAVETEWAAQREYGHRSLDARCESLTSQWCRGPAEATLDDFSELVVGLGIGMLLDGAHLEDESVGANPYAVAELTELCERLRLLLDRLPERERKIVQLHYIQQCPFTELACVLGLSKGRISQLHARGLRMLRDMLNELPTINRQL